jgi:multidrug transporter EmrE-like cation transporter
MQLVLLFLGGIALTVGDIFMKKWSITDMTTWLIAGFSTWMIGLCFLAATFRQMNIAIASVILVFVNVASLSVAEQFWFDNPITATKLCGLVLGLLSICILELT